MTRNDASTLHLDLDDDHLPETNGRIAVCRRCGLRTTMLAGEHHAPVAAQDARAREWLNAQELSRVIARAQRTLGT